MGTLGSRSLRARVLASFALTLTLALIAVSCGGSSSPTPGASAQPPQPTPTPDRHLHEPVTTDAIFNLLVAGKISVQRDTALTGQPGAEPIETLNLIYHGQPLAILEFSSSKAVTAAGWSSAAKIDFGDSAYTFYSLNVVIHLGPRSHAVKPAAPDTDLAQLANQLVAVLDPYLGPFNQLSVIPLDLPTVATPAPTASPSGKPSPKPKPKPKPTPKPKPKPTPKH